LPFGRSRFPIHSPSMHIQPVQLAASQSLSDRHSVSVPFCLSESQEKTLFAFSINCKLQFCLKEIPSFVDSSVMLSFPFPKHVTKVKLSFIYFTNSLQKNYEKI
jgi:hypothetical protein